MSCYKKVIRPVFFQMDPERAHHFAFGALEVGQRVGLERIVRRFCRIDAPELAQCVWGIDFRSPLGLAAGFDKDCRAVPFWSALGFGFLEIGTITNEPQPGNERPRIFRIPADEALINRMGFPSRGAAVLAQRLASLPAGPERAVLAVNIGKTKRIALDEAVDDYAASFQTLRSFGDLFVVNVSSPNTP